MASRRLVVDTDVAQSCGMEGGPDPRPRRCRDLLVAILDVCHHVVLTRELSLEWNKHQSRYARTWRTGMNGHRKVFNPQSDPHADLMERIIRATPDEKARDAMRKDFHLIVAALASDCIIISLDDEARELFREAAHKVGELRDIAWVNPLAPGFDPIAWLTTGAEPVAAFKLG